MIRSLTKGFCSARGQSKVCGDTLWNGKFIVNGVIFIVPIGTNGTEFGIDRAIGISETAVGMGGEGDLAIGGGILHRLNANGFSKYPIVNRTVGVVVKGVHIAAPKAAVLFNAVPVLPNSGGTVIDGE